MENGIMNTSSDSRNFSDLGIVVLPADAIKNFRRVYRKNRFLCTLLSPVFIAAVFVNSILELILVIIHGIRYKWDSFIIGDSSYPYDRYVLFFRDLWCKKFNFLVWFSSDFHLTPLFSTQQHSNQIKYVFSLKYSIIFFMFVQPIVTTIVSALPIGLVFVAFIFLNIATKVYVILFIFIAWISTFILSRFVIFEVILSFFLAGKVVDTTIRLTVDNSPSEREGGKLGLVSRFFQSFSFAISNCSGQVACSLYNHCQPKPMHPIPEDHQNSYQGMVSTRSNHLLQPDDARIPSFSSLPPPSPALTQSHSQPPPYSSNLQTQNKTRARSLPSSPSGSKFYGRAFLKTQESIDDDTESHSSRDSDRDSHDDAFLDFSKGISQFVTETVAEVAQTVDDTHRKTFRNDKINQNQQLRDEFETRKKCFQKMNDSILRKSSTKDSLKTTEKDRAQERRTKCEKKIRSKSIHDNTTSIKNKDISLQMSKSSDDSNQDRSIYHQALRDGMRRKAKIDALSTCKIHESSDYSRRQVPSDSVAQTQAQSKNDSEALDTYLITSPPPPYSKLVYRESQEYFSSPDIPSSDTRPIYHDLVTPGQKQDDRVVSLSTETPSAPAVEEKISRSTRLSSFDDTTYDRYSLDDSAFIQDESTEDEVVAPSPVVYRSFYQHYMDLDKDSSISRIPLSRDVRRDISEVDKVAPLRLYDQFSPPSSPQNSDNQIDDNPPPPYYSTLSPQRLSSSSFNKVRIHFPESVDTPSRRAKTRSFLEREVYRECPQNNIENSKTSVISRKKDVRRSLTSDLYEVGPEQVRFSTYAPHEVTPYMKFAFNIWAYLRRQYQEMHEAATSDGISTAMGVTRSCHIRRGAMVHVILDAPTGFRILGKNSKAFVWNGNVTNVNFMVEYQDEHAKFEEADSHAIFRVRVVVGDTVARLTSYVLVNPRKHTLLSDNQIEEEDLEELESEFELLPRQVVEIDYSTLNITELLGSGHFGDAYLANWKGKDVVVKTLRPSSLSSPIESFRDSPEIECSNKENGILAEELRHEASIHSMFGHHPCIVPFVGACTDESKPLALVTEYMPFGSLADHIYSSNKTDHSWSVLKRSSMLSDAAMGVMNLHEARFVHRDIAARNCLIEENHRVRICDFGLTRCIAKKFNRGVGYAESGFGPLRWMAPESIVPPHVFSLQSDSYMFGVLMWEVYMGKQPYTGMDTQSAMAQVLEGRCLDLPRHVPKSIVQCMEKCFNEDPEKRPPIHEIYETLSNTLPLREEELN